MLHKDYIIYESKKNESRYNKITKGYGELIQVAIRTYVYATGDICKE